MNNIKTIKDIFQNSVSKYESMQLFAAKFIFRNEKQYSINYATYYLNVRKIAHYLHDSLKIRKGDKIGIFSDNRPEWGIAYFAINYLGAIVVPIDSKSTLSEIDFIVDHSDLKTVFVSLSLLDKIEETNICRSKIKKFIVFDEKLTFDNKKDISYESLLHNESINDFSVIDSIEMLESDIASIIYTSGTTGGAKGVLLTNKNIVSNIKMIEDVSPFKVGDKVLSILPLHHTFETTVGFLTMFKLGLTVVYLELISPTGIIKTIKSERIVGMVVVPLFIKKIYDKISKEIEKSLVSSYMVKSLQLLAHGLKLCKVKDANSKAMHLVKKKAGLDSLMVFFSGAAALQLEVGIGMERLGFNVMQGYGLTEASPVVSVNLIGANKHGSIGRALPGVTVTIENKSSDGIGEIVVEGDNVMLGYYNDKDATDAVIRNGKLYTGDLGYKDDEGYVFITGRSKNVLVTNGGKNIYPESIEEIIDRSEYILESIILGMKNSNDNGEVPYAIIVPHLENIEANLGESYRDFSLIDELMKKEIKLVNEQLIDYKKIKGYKISMEELPKTSTKKIKRYLLKNDINMVE